MSVNYFKNFDIYNEWEITENEIEGYLLVKKGSVKKFKELNLERKNIKYKGSYLLFETILHDRLDILKYLVETGASLDIVDRYDRNLLQFAIIYNKRDFINYLLNLKHSFNISNEVYDLLDDNFDVNSIHKLDYFLGSSLMCYICALGLENIFKKIDFKGSNSLMVNMLKEVDSEGFTCIDRSAANGNLNMLIELKNVLDLEIDYKNPVACSLLYKAIKYGPNEEVIEWWLTNANLNNKSLNQQEFKNILLEVNGPTTEALKSKLKVILPNISQSTLIELDENSNNLLMATLKKCKENVKFNIFHGLIPNDDNNNYLRQINDEHQTLLHIAAKTCNKDIFSSIETYGLNELVHRRDNRNYTCYMYAIEEGYYELVEFIVNKFNITQNNFELQNLAIINQRNKIFHFLYEKANFITSDFRIRAHKEANEANADFLLRIAESSKNNLDNKDGFILNILKNCKLEHLINLKIPFQSYTDSEEAKIIHVLALFGRIDIIKWLYEKENYNITLTDKDGFTALYYAISNKQTETIKLLISIGIDCVDENQILRYEIYYNDDGTIKYRKVKHYQCQK